MADLQESGVPVTYGYISDLHERKAFDHGPCTTATATGSGKPIGPGDACYDENGKAYDAAFATFFQRLAADGINPSNTLFVISAEENDQFAGANASARPEADPSHAATAPSETTAATRRAPSASSRPTSRACSRRRPAPARRTTWSLRVPRSTPTGSPGSTTRPCVSWSATPQR